ncbi:hypothetical protein HOU00_gp369 [Caulobacter phage CcrPW]|uniref:Uncharacterized protein n=1 Tax=Caulobacter phage CcrPW TaxID=2283271 RepID=A0A385EAJ1_9CAUD|nr:hypothetical protein HOU00_gp369 [Caulobacter phage CcrPW]AXQ68756.1 hypothetical protein CcrPW_gp217c [Caulobacter phage CcrPW]
MAYDTSPEKPTFDRQRPLFRAFLSDEDNSIAWHHVSVDFTPGDALTETEVNNLYFIYSLQPWWPSFIERLNLNRKATIYTSLDLWGRHEIDLTLEVDGELDRATIFKYDKYNIARGVLVSEDRKGRFRRGEIITTSYILAGPDEKGIIRTRNSVYRLLNWKKA